MASRRATGFEPKPRPRGSDEPFMPLHPTFLDLDAPTGSNGRWHWCPGRARLGVYRRPVGLTLARVVSATRVHDAPGYPYRPRKHRLGRSIDADPHTIWP